MVCYFKKRLKSVLLTMQAIFSTNIIKVFEFGSKLQIFFQSHAIIYSFA